MGSWRKTLQGMVADRKSRAYTYNDAATVLTQLGFELVSPRSGTSHRKWRRVVDGSGPRRLAVIGLLDQGSGTMPREYLKHMIDTLETFDLLNGIIP